jgi:hypothetical protein
MNTKRIWQVMAVLGVGLLSLVGVAGARAEAALPTEYVLYLSAPGNGTVAGVAYADEDVLRYAPHLNPQWAVHFDGSNAGLPAAADIDAYDYRHHNPTFTSWHYISFDKPVAVPGLGIVDDSDVVLYYQSSLLGNSWRMFFDGSQYGLTTNAEDVDSIEVYSNGYMNFSTSGNYAVPHPPNFVLKGGDEDVLAWVASESSYYPANFIISDEWGIPAANDLVNMANPDWENGTYLFFTLLKPATLDGNGPPFNTGPFDIVSRWFSNDEMSLVWDASDNGFSKIDALDVYAP